MYPRFKKLLLAIIIVIPISSFFAIGQAQTLRLGLNSGSRVSISAGQSLQGASVSIWLSKRDHFLSDDSLRRV